MAAFAVFANPLENRLFLARVTMPKRDMWLARHNNVHFHYTPTRTSRVNQIEIWFSILAGKSLNGASFNAVDQLKTHVDAFITAYNETAKPFVWTKSKVHQKRLRTCFAEPRVPWPTRVRPGQAYRVRCM